MRPSLIVGAASAANTQMNQTGTRPATPPFAAEAAPTKKSSTSCARFLQMSPPWCGYTHRGGRFRDKIFNLLQQYSKAHRIDDSILTSRTCLLRILQKR